MTKKKTQETAFERLLDNLTGTDKAKQAEAAFYFANTPCGYDTAVYFLPKDRRREFADLFTAARQVEYMNKCDGVITGAGIEMHLQIAITAAKSLALCSLLDMKEQGRACPETLEAINQSEDLADLSGVYSVNEQGQVVFKKDLSREANKAVSECYKTISSLKALTGTAFEVAAWEHFGRFVEPPLLRNCQAIVEAFPELCAVSERYVLTLGRCSGQAWEHFGRWGEGFPTPETIPADKTTLKRWQGYFNELKVKL